MKRTDRYQVIYDGDCSMCRRIVAALRSWDRHGILEFIPGHPESLQLIAPDGTTWQAAAAVEQLITILPRGRLISWVFRVPLVRGIAERVYRSIARNRYRLGCGDHCRVL